MKIIIIVIAFFLAPTCLISNDTDISISNVKVMKRNKPTCDRLGNIYDACQWMLKFKINNNTGNDLISFCSVVKVNKKKYKLCGNKAKNKFHTKANNSTVLLTNLSELINYDNEKPKSIVSFISLNGKF
tara:strand:+ start:816 stop:1202 length:387 start_codon:yes stop_codon:yes gene_type:complete